METIDCTDNSPKNELKSVIYTRWGNVLFNYFWPEKMTILVYDVSKAVYIYQSVINWPQQCPVRRRVEQCIAHVLMSWVRLYWYNWQVNVLYTSAHSRGQWIHMY